MKVSEALYIGEPNKGESLIAKPPAQLGGTHVSFAPSPTPDGEGSSYDDVKQYPDLLNDLRALIPKLGLDQAGQNLLRTKLDQKRVDAIVSLATAELHHSMLTIAQWPNLDRF